MKRSYYNIGALISFEAEGKTEEQINEVLTEVLNDGLKVASNKLTTLKVHDSFICRDKENEKLEELEKFISLEDQQDLFSEEELFNIFSTVRDSFIKKSGLMVDSSDVFVLTVFPFSEDLFFNHLDEVPEHYEVKNYLVGLYEGKPALKFKEELFICE